MRSLRGKATMMATATTASTGRSRTSRIAVHTSATTIGARIRWYADQRPGRELDECRLPSVKGRWDFDTTGLQLIGLTFPFALKAVLPKLLYQVPLSHARWNLFAPCGLRLEGIG